MVAINLSIDKETLELLNKLSKVHGIPKSAIVKVAIRQYAMNNAKNVGALLILKELAEMHYDLYALFQIVLAMNKDYCDLDVLKRLEMVLSEKAKEYLKLSKVLEKVLTR